MLYLEQLLSPFITSQSNPGKDVLEEQKQLMQRIREQKLSVSEKGCVPDDASLVRPEIMESWMRCFEYGLDPFHYNFPAVMDPDEFQDRLKEKAFFLEAAEPYMCQFDKMLSDMGCYLFLSDERGIILRTANTLGENRFWLTPGAIWSEETIGTCSHGMSIWLKSPIQVCGPEHFSQIFKNISCSTAPVFDTCGNMEGTLSISSSYLHGQSSHSLGLVVTIASAIQKEFQLAEKKNLLSIALSATHDAVFVVSGAGEIVTVNTVARNLFRNDLEGLNISDIVGDQPLIKTVIDSGREILNADVIIARGQRRFHLKSVRPVANHSCPHSGCVLTLKEVTPVGGIPRNTSCSPTKYTFSRIVGSSSSTVESIELAKKFCRFDNNILLQGESGTGKEVYAQAIHNQSRPGGPFIAVNCAAIPATLIESELFGYEPGAFTGAGRKGKPGKIEMANGGTLFLDEIGDMPLELQAVLLRVLEDKLVMRVGGSRYIPVDFRLVAATNRDLAALMEGASFREDLYYRLSAFKVDIAPLRSRGGDIIELAEFFISSISQSRQVKRPTLCNSTKYFLLQHSWPGNVRQLQNAIAYAVCMCEEGSILPEHLPKELVDKCLTPTLLEHQPCEGAEGSEKEGDGNLSMKDIEKMMIKKALDSTNNHIRAAARVLGISKSTIYRKIKEYEIVI